MALKKNFADFGFAEWGFKVILISRPILTQPNLIRTFVFFHNKKRKKTKRMEAGTVDSQSDQAGRKMRRRHNYGRRVARWGAPRGAPPFL